MNRDVILGALNDRDIVNSSLHTIFLLALGFAIFILVPGKSILAWVALIIILASMILHGIDAVSECYEYLDSRTEDTEIDDEHAQIRRDLADLKARLESAHETD